MERRFRLGSLYYGDARQLIQKLPDGCVNLILTDPPYGLGTDEYDDGDLLFELEPELWRVAASDAWLVFYWSTKLLPKAFELRHFEYVWLLVCLLQNSPTRTPIGGAHYQAVLVFKKGEPKLNMRMSDIIYSTDLFKPVKDPQFKCTASIGSLIQTFSKPGDLVLDLSLIHI